MLVAKQPLFQPQPPLRQPVRAPQKKTKTALITDADKRIIIAAILLTAVISFGMIWRFAAVNDLQTRVNQLERSIAALEDENAALIIQLKQLSAPRRIENRANLELGMRWPEQQQIINVLEPGPEH
ncbi:MAG TPA: cell division protein FtsL [Firmicutes bacterium]|nr:cell division protein FtsL [Bacillota bacterium]